MATATTTRMMGAVTQPEPGRKGVVIGSLQAGGGSAGLPQHTRMQTHTHTHHTLLACMVCPTCMQGQTAVCGSSTQSTSTARPYVVC